MLVHHSSTRRKACAECVRVKRRCDLGLPQCTRCGKRGLHCQYVIPSKQTDEGQVATERVRAHQAASNNTASVSSRPSSVEITPLDSFAFPELAPISKEQVEFCIHQFQACITQLVQGSRLPFIHHTSHRAEFPQDHQDLLGVSAMYHQKTPESQGIVFSMLDKSISRLVASASSWAMEELLLGTQALIVYQIIRLFDGDIRQRANAERQLTLLEAWTSRLQEAFAAFHNSLLLNKSTYDRWVVIESARRTVLVSVMLQALYSLLKDGICTSVPLMSTLPVSLDGALWNMPEDDWWKATSGVESAPVTYREYVSKWSHGDPLQIDVYETILLVACKHNSKRLSFVAS